VITGNAGLDLAFPRDVSILERNNRARHNTAPRNVSKLAYKAEGRGKRISDNEDTIERINVKSAAAYVNPHRKIRASVITNDRPREFRELSRRHFFL